MVQRRTPIRPLSKSFVSAFCKSGHDWISRSGPAAGAICSKASALSTRVFDAREGLITCCRKDRNLPLDICAEDGKRAVDGLEKFDEPDAETEADDLFDYVLDAHNHYNPISFWDALHVYVETGTEKSDLKSLFSRIATPFHIPIRISADGVTSTFAPE